MHPLRNIKVIELAGLAPVPLCGMILSDYGAKVIRVDNAKAFIRDEILNRGKQSICLNLKISKEIKILKHLIKTADVLLDPYRPGVLEKLSLAPEELQRDNPKLIVARLSGYGQVRPDDNKDIVKLKNSAGHDINYLAMSGVLSRLGPEACPQAPVNLLADFGAGAMSCINGILLALLSRVTTGKGQLVDCSMALSCAYVYSFLWRGRDKTPFLWPHPDHRCSNFLDGGAPFYRCYETKDHKFVAVGALEPQFYRSLLGLLAVPEEEAPQHLVSSWPSFTARFSEVFSSRTQQQWVQAAMSAGECCLTPVLDLDEAADFWHNDFLHLGDGEGKSEPGPQPRLADFKTPREESLLRPVGGQDTETVLREAGCSEDDISSVLANLKGAI